MTSSSSDVGRPNLSEAEIVSRRVIISDLPESKMLIFKDERFLIVGNAISDRRERKLGEVHFISAVFKIKRQRRSVC